MITGQLTNLIIAVQLYPCTVKYGLNNRQRKAREKDERLLSKL